ncbi:MAG: N-glycosylase/DNA lyase [Candidatus Verstraetearchaeota archaeon]|nr:N-glycosylase/DNA lyase [Candidatus Verstraetearchaeota archaeon]
MDKLNRLYSNEMHVHVTLEECRALEVVFSGGIIGSCCARDYFDDLGIVLSETHGVDYVYWDARLNRASPPYYLVRYARIDFLDELKKVMPEAEPMVKKRIEEFAKVGASMNPDRIFSELCFCILTANCSAEGGIRIQQTVGDGFRSIEQKELTSILRSLGYRFPNRRSEFICTAKGSIPKIMDALHMDDRMAREWLVENIKGIGYKEASHFLRNIGRNDLAIIDRHVLRFLLQKGLILKTPKSLSRTSYMAFETLLAKISEKLGITLAELDLYIWYLMTGKVLK